MTDANETKVVAMLDGIATKIGTTVETLWPHAVRYEALSALLSALGFGIGTALCGWAVVRMFRAMRLVRGQYGETDQMAFGFGIAIAGGVGIGLLMGFVTSIPAIIEPTGSLVADVLKRH